VVTPRRVLGVLASLALVAATGTAAPVLAGGTSNAPVPAPGQTLLSQISPFTWSGWVWVPRASVQPEQAGHNYWSPRPNSVFVDTQGRLHLKIVNELGNWWAAQLTSAESDFGYGTYRWVVDTPLQNFDPATVLGLFTYNKTAADPNARPQAQTGHNEADFELTKFGRSRNTFNSQVTVQPYFAPNHYRRINLPKSSPTLTYEMTWGPAGTLFVVRQGADPAGRVIARWKTPLQIGLPRSGTTVNMNLWLWYGPPQNGQTQEAIIRSFDYTPLNAGSTVRLP
jgi:hypothetical protein